MDALDDGPPPPETPVLGRGVCDVRQLGLELARDPDYAAPEACLELRRMVCTEYPSSSVQHLAYVS